MLSTRDTRMNNIHFVRFASKACYVNPAHIQSVADLNQQAEIRPKDTKYGFREQNIDSQRLNGKRYAGLIVPESYISVRKTKFLQNIHVKALIDRFEHGKPWAETAYGAELFDGWYKHIFKGAFKNRTFQEFENHRLREWDDIFLDIEKNGYREAANPLDNVEVSVTSDGKMHFVDGRHRLYFAQLLKIEKIPVIVNQWSISFIRKFGTLNGEKLRNHIEAMSEINGS